MEARSVFTWCVRQKGLVGSGILNHRAGIFEVIFKGLDPGPGRMGEVSFAFPNEGQRPVQVRFDQGNGYGKIRRNALTNGVRHEGNAEFARYHLSQEVQLLERQTIFGWA